MENTTEILRSFCEKHDLWNLTKISAFECIQNYIEEGSEGNELVFEEITLKPQKQELVFWYYENETFIVRTTYTLYKNNEFSIPIGDYAMDVNADGEIIDDWFVIY